jgi:tetratricopeptide (TPR) repeat protein
LVDGVDLDLIEAMPLIKALQAPMVPSRGLISIQQPARPKLPVDKKASGENPCATERGGAELVLAGIALRSAHRLQEALNCFEKATRLQEANIAAHVGAAQVGTLTRGSEEIVREHFDRVSSLEPGFRDLVELRVASLGFAYGRPREAASAIKVFLTGKRSLLHRRLAGMMLVEWALSDGSLQDALFGQEKLVQSLARKRQLDGARAETYKLVFDYDRLGLLLEADGNLAGALAAYKSALEISDSQIYSFEPNLGRLRVLRRLERKDGVDRECTDLRLRVESASFRIPDRANGGLDVARARLAISCGDTRRGLAILESLMTKRPNWDQPVLVLRDHLLSRGLWDQAQQVYRTAGRIKAKRDQEVIHGILQELERLSPR